MKATTKLDDNSIYEDEVFNQLGLDLASQNDCDDIVDKNLGFFAIDGKQEVDVNQTSMSDQKEVKSVEYYHNIIKRNLGSNQVDPLQILKEMEENLKVIGIESFNILLYNSLNNKKTEAFKILSERVFRDENKPESKTENKDRIVPDMTTIIILIKYEKQKAKSAIKNLGTVDFNRECEKEQIFKAFDTKIAEIKKRFEDFSGEKPSLQVENTILDILLEQKRFYSAWEHFESIRTIADPYTYSSILKGIHLTPNLAPIWLDKAFDLMYEAKEKKLEIEEIFYNTLLDACIKFNRIDKAEYLFFEMSDTCDVHSEHTYSIMIKAYGKAKDIDKATYIFEEIKTHYELPSSITYGCMMNIYVKCGFTDLAKDLMIEMDGKGIKQNLHTYSILINGYRLAKNLKSALAIFERAKKEKDQNIVIYNAILDCCIYCEDYAKMREIFKYLNETSRTNDKFPQPDLITYSIVMKGVAKTNDVERVLEVYEYLLERKDFILDKHMYNTVMDFFAKKKEEKNVLMVYNDMLSKNIEIEIVTYGVLIKLYCNLNNPGKALELYQEVLSKKMKPNVVILQLLLKALFKSKQFVDKAISIFKNLKTMEINLDNIIYELVINGCLKYHRYTEAFEFYLKGANEELNLNLELQSVIFETIIVSEKLDNGKKKELLRKLLKQAEEKKFELENPVKELCTRIITDSIDINQIKQYCKENMQHSHNHGQSNGYNNGSGYSNKKNHESQQNNYNQQHSYKHKNNYQNNHHNNHHSQRNQYEEYNQGGNQSQGFQGQGYNSNSYNYYGNQYQGGQGQQNSQGYGYNNVYNNTYNNHSKQQKKGTNQSNPNQTSQITYTSNGKSQQSNQYQQPTNNQGYSSGSGSGFGMNQSKYNNNHSNSKQKRTSIGNENEYYAKSHDYYHGKDSYASYSNGNYENSSSYDNNYEGFDQNYKNKFTTDKAKNKFEGCSIQINSFVNLDKIAKPFNEAECKYFVECNNSGSFGGKQVSNESYYVESKSVQRHSGFNSFNTNPNSSYQKPYSKNYDSKSKFNNNGFNYASASNQEQRYYRSDHEEVKHYY